MQIQVKQAKRLQMGHTFVRYVRTGQHESLKICESFHLCKPLETAIRNPTNIRAQHVKEGDVAQVLQSRIVDGTAGVTLPLDVQNPERPRGKLLRRCDWNVVIEKDL